MIVYLLAIASPTHPVPARMYHTGWAGQSDRAVEYRRWWSRTTQGDHYSNGNTYYEIKLDVGEGNGAELFFTHYSFLGFDPRDKKDPTPTISRTTATSLSSTMHTRLRIPENTSATVITPGAVPPASTRPVVAPIRATIMAPSPVPLRSRPSRTRPSNP